MRRLFHFGTVARERVGWLALKGILFNRLVDYWIAFCMLNHMVEYMETALDDIFHALGDATRRRMLRELAFGERTVSQLAAPFDMSLAAASKHIKVLEGAGLIRRDVKGRTHFCTLEPGPLAKAHEWLEFYERFWTGRLDELERLLRKEDGHEARTRERGEEQ